MDSIQDANRELLFSLMATSAKLERQFDRALSHIKGVSFSEYQLLRALQNQHDASATRVDLASAVGLTPSGVTRALKPLEKIGYVTTVRDERDARRSLASLTRHGVTLIADASNVVHDVIAEMAALKGLKAADRQRILNLMLELSRG